MIPISTERLRQLQPGETVIVTHRQNGRPLVGQGDVTSPLTRITKETGRSFTTRRYILVEQTQPSAMTAIAITRQS